MSPRRDQARLFALLAVLLLGAFLNTRIAQSQVSGATLKGTVTDPAGAAVPKAQVVISDLATGITHPAVTDSAGVYSMPNLRPGTYEVRVTAPGFSTAVRSGITLAVGAQQVLDIVLRVACCLFCSCFTSSPSLTE